MSNTGQSRFGSARAWWSRRGKFSKVAIIIGALIVVITIIPSGDDTNVAVPGEGPRTLSGVAWEFETGDEVFSSPAVAGGTVYVGSWDNNLYALE